MESSPLPAGREPAPPIPAPASRVRTGLSALERKATYRVHTEIAAMPASLVVQILLWPERITDWARDENVTPALVYNMLGGFKPYHGLRERLAQRLGVTKSAVDHLIDARAQQPSSRRIPEPPDDFAPAAWRPKPPPMADGPAERVEGKGSAELHAPEDAEPAEPRAAEERPEGDAPNGERGESQTTFDL